MQKVLIIFFFMFCLGLTHLFGQESSFVISSRVERIVRKLSREDMLHLGAPVGYAGKPETGNRYYKTYLKLVSKASEQELVALCQSNNKLIVVYAYYALAEKGYTGLTAIF